MSTYCFWFESSDLLPAFLARSQLARRSSVVKERSRTYVCIGIVVRRRWRRFRVVVFGVRLVRVGGRGGTSIGVRRFRRSVFLGRLGGVCGGFRRPRAAPRNLRGRSAYLGR
jgi:hypothetical protein